MSRWLPTGRPTTCRRGRAASGTSAVSRRGPAALAQRFDGFGREPARPGALPPASCSCGDRRGAADLAERFGASTCTSRSRSVAASEASRSDDRAPDSAAGLPPRRRARASASTASRRTSDAGMRSGQVHERREAALAFDRRRSCPRPPPGRRGSGSSRNFFEHVHDRVPRGMASPSVSIASRRTRRRGGSAPARAGRYAALVLEVAERFHGLALDFAIGILPGNRGQRVGRRRLGPRAQRLDRLAPRVRIGQRPGQRDQHRRGFGSARSPSASAASWRTCELRSAARDAIQRGDRGRNRMLGDPLGGIAAQVVGVLAGDPPFEPARRPPPSRRATPATPTRSCFKSGSRDRAIEADRRGRGSARHRPLRARRPAGPSSRPASRAC